MFAYGTCADHDRWGSPHGSPRAHAHSHQHPLPPPWFFEMIGGRRRAERGDVRYLILDALRDVQRHGYEIIQRIEEKTNGAYKPSPGAVYPTLQMLEEMGSVRSREDAGKRVYEITEEGLADLVAHDDDVEEAYDRLGGDMRLEQAQAFMSLFERTGKALRYVGRQYRRGRLGEDQLAAIRDVIDSASERIEAIAKGK